MIIYWAWGHCYLLPCRQSSTWGGETGSFPTKGMSLPFISYGGSNLVVVFILIGLVINVLRRIDKPAPYNRENYEKYCNWLWGTGGHLTPGIALAQALEQKGCASWLLISRKQVDSGCHRSIQS